MGPEPLRQWCVDKAIEWIGRPNDDVETANMLCEAALIERYVTTGMHSPMIEQALLLSAMEEAERVTPNVGLSKAKAVCDKVADFCGLTRKPTHETHEG